MSEFSPDGIEAMYDCINFGGSAEQALTAYLNVTGTALVQKSGVDWRLIDSFPFDGAWPAELLLVWGKCGGPELVWRSVDDQWRHESDFMERYSHWASVNVPKAAKFSGD